MLETKTSWQYAEEYISKIKTTKEERKINYEDVCNELKHTLSAIMIKLEIWHPEAYERIKKELQK